MNLTGQIEGNQPLISLRVEGDAASLGDDIDGIIDTGFDGFICMDAERAFQIGLTPVGTIDVMLADATIGEMATATCHIVFDDRTVEGNALIGNAGSLVLYGMDFLKRAGLRLTVDTARQIWTLTDEP